MASSDSGGEPATGDEGEQGDQLAFAALQVKERQVSRSRRRRRMEREEG